MKSTALAAIEHKLAYSFNDRSLIQLALTHRSVSQSNNQRLEYLGDAVLGCIIAAYLYQYFPDAQEGGLSQMRASLVNKESLAKLANQLDIQPFLQLGPGERQTAGIVDSILADAMEAIIGAIYIDADFISCKKCVLKWFAPELNKLAKQAPHANKNAKSKLQEYCQAFGNPIPRYNISAISGKQHQQVFHATCSIEQPKHVTKGSGQTKRSAEQKAASIMLNWLKQNNKDNVND